MAGRVTIQAQLNELPQGTVSIPTITITPTASNLVETRNLVLASGANVIAVPTWAVGVLIQPATTNAVALTLKGVTGDTGIPISPVAPCLLSFPETPPASIEITAASLTDTDTTVTFF